MTASVPRRPGAHSMLLLPTRESNVQYDSYIVQSKRSLHTKQSHVPPRSWGTGRWDRKGTLFSCNTGSDDKHSLFVPFFILFFNFFLQMVITENKFTTYKRVASGHYIPSFFFLSYSNISWSTSRHQWQPQREKKNTSEDASAHEHFV